MNRMGGARYYMTLQNIRLDVLLTLTGDKLCT